MTWLPIHHDCLLLKLQIIYSNNICLDSYEYAYLMPHAKKHAMRLSVYEQARCYFDAGVFLLGANPWQTQYSLCLKLHEMAVNACFVVVDGQVDNVPRTLNAILNNAKADDALDARALLARLFMSQLKYADGINEFIKILSDLKEDIPADMDPQKAMSEIEAVTPLLNGISSKNELLALPAMTDQQKKKIMKYLSLMLSYCVIHLPPLSILLSCRLIKHTFWLGFCEDSLLGFVTICRLTFLHGLSLFSPINVSHFIIPYQV